MGRRQVRKGIRGRVATTEARQANKDTTVSVATAERRPETRTYRLREYTRLKAVQRYKFHTTIKNLIIKNRLTALICSSPPTISEEKKEQYFKELVLHPPGMPGLHAQPLPRFARVPCFRVALTRYTVYTLGIGSKSPTHSQRGDDRYAKEFEGAQPPLKHAKPTRTPP